MDTREAFEKEVSLPPWIEYDEKRTKYKLSERASHTQVNYEILCMFNRNWEVWKARDVEIEALRAQLAERNALIAELSEVAEKYRAINTPEIKDFIKAIELEAMHQRERWGANGDAGKEDSDWFWLIGYLAGKAIHKPEKQLHHIITTAAACLNWHAARTGNYKLMRAGIEPPDEALALKPKELG